MGEGYEYWFGVAMAFGALWISVLSNPTQPAWEMAAGLTMALPVAFGLVKVLSFLRRWRIRIDRRTP